MSKPFLVCGLPRSRTAWWSLASTTAQSTCVHEPLKDCADFDAYKAMWNGTASFVGVSDSGAVSFLERLLDEVQPQTLVVRRDVREVEASLAKYFSVQTLPAELSRYLAEASATLDAFAEHPLVEVVDFAALNDIDVVEDCLAWLMPGLAAPFNRELMKMNVQPDIRYLMSEVAKPGAFRFLKDTKAWLQ